MDVDIPIEAFWAALGFLVVTGVTALIWFIKWQSSVLTVERHEVICTDAQNRVVEMLKDQNTVRAANHLENQTDIKAIRTDVGELKSDVRVLQALQGNGASHAQ